jgi:large subunit ribosomal protein L24
VSLKIKRGDQVIWITANEKDQYTTDKKGVKTRRIGKVLKVLVSKNQAIVEGFNLIVKHQKPNNQEEKGKKVESEAPINISNLLLIEPKSGLPTKVGFKVIDGQKVRYAKKNGEFLDQLRRSKKASSELKKVEEKKADDKKASPAEAKKE